MDYHREHKLKIKIIRIFNTYGPNMAIMMESCFKFYTQAIRKKI